MNQTLEVDEDELVKISSKKLHKLSNGGEKGDEEASVSIDLESMEFISLEPKRMVKCLIEKNLNSINIFIYHKRETKIF